MTLIRAAPAAPAGLVGGPNTIYVSGAAKAVTELEWKANSERNVIGYRVYNENGALVCPGDCADPLLEAVVHRHGKPRLDVHGQGPVSQRLRRGHRRPPSTAHDQRPSPDLLLQEHRLPAASRTVAPAPRRDMVEGFPGLDPEATFAARLGAGRSTSAPRRSPPAKTLTAGDANVNVYLENNHRPATRTRASVTGQLFRSGTSTALDSAVNHTVPPGTPVNPTHAARWARCPRPRSRAGERLNLLLTWGTTTGAARPSCTTAARPTARR
ncbi:MAG: hypothetical protein WKF40_07075 [Thermoleophilaceae bacterium]